MASGHVCVPVPAVLSFRLAVARVVRAFRPERYIYSRAREDRSDTTFWAGSRGLSAYPSIFLMLPVQHRITSSGEYSQIMREGTRAGSSTVVATVRFACGDEVKWRCGFVVSKAVGNAVVRHSTTRRLRHIVKDLMLQPDFDIPAGLQMQIVIRALRQAPEVSHLELREDVSSVMRRAVRKAKRKFSVDNEFGATS